MCVCVVPRSPSQFAKSPSVFQVAVAVERPCARRWAGRTAARDFTAPSVENSVKVRFFRR